MVINDSTDETTQSHDRDQSEKKVRSRILFLAFNFSS